MWSAEDWDYLVRLWFNAILLWRRAADPTLRPGKRWRARMLLARNPVVELATLSLEEDAR